MLHLRRTEELKSLLKTRMIRKFLEKFNLGALLQRGKKAFKVGRNCLKAIGIIDKNIPLI